MQNLIYTLFGIVLYEMLTGRVPFDADTPVSVALKQVQEEPVEPIKYNSQIPNSVNMIILKAMQKNPNYRYQNATEMLEDLTRSLKEPDENFVVIHKPGDSPTQKIPTIYDINLDKNVSRKAEIDGKNEDEDEEELKFFQKHKVLKFFLIFLVVIIVFCTAVFVGARSKFGKPTEIQVPNLVVDENNNPMSEEAAIELLKQLGFTNYKIEREYSDDVEKGYVISQKPEFQDNYKINETEEFTIVVSQGTEDAELAEKLKNTKVKLPKKMIGKKKEDLIAELDKLTEELDDEDLVIKYEITEEFNEEVEAGIVTDVDHEAGEEITLDTKLNITVSKGSQYKDIVVPSVINKSESDAKNTLSGLGLVVDVNYEENSNKSDGVVISQSVNANKTVKEGSSITITVNKLPTKSTVTVNVNLKSLMNYTEPEAVQETVTNINTDGNVTDNNSANASSTTTTPEIKSAKVVIKVGDDTIYSESNKLNTTNISSSYSTSGVKEVKVYVDDVVKYNKTVDFSQGNQTVTVE